MINFFKKTFHKFMSKFKWKNKKHMDTPMSSSIVILDDAKREKKETGVLDVNLLDDNASKTDKKKVRQYTKVLITTLTACSCIWISTSYILASVALIMYGNTELLSTLSEKVCEVILGTVCAYSLKSFFETFSQKGMELLDKKSKKTLDTPEELTDINNENTDAMG